MEKVKRASPVDLMLDGKMDEAAEIYLDLYVEALAEGDRFIGPYLLPPLHSCVASVKGGETLDDVSKNVEAMIWKKAGERGVKRNKETETDVSDDISIAREYMAFAAKGVEEDDDEDWI